MKDSKSIKDFYAGYADHITQKRSESSYVLRKYIHQQQYESIAKFVQPGMKVLDDGCGEGALSFLLAMKGASVIGCDISRSNIEVCNILESKNESLDMTFLTADAEELPFPDNSFDIVVSSHVLEHLPDFDKGLQEIMRVSKKRAIIAIPTICSPCSLVQVGHGWFWLKGIRSFFGFFHGLWRLLVAFIRDEEGVDEGYAGNNVPHIFRFPSVMEKKVKKLGFKLLSYEADAFCIPYFEFFLPIIKMLNTSRARTILRKFGYGTLYVIEK